MTSQAPRHYWARARNVWTDRPFGLRDHLWYPYGDGEDRALCDDWGQKRGISPDATLTSRKQCSVCARREPELSRD